MSVVRRDLNTISLGLDPDPNLGNTQPSLRTGHILDCVAMGVDAQGQTAAKIFFSPDAPAEHILPVIETIGGTCRSVGGGLIADVPCKGSNQLHLAFPDQPIDVFADADEQGIFSGLNCALSERNGETADIILDWLLWHVENHRLQGVLIIDRATPKDADLFAEDLKALIAGSRLAQVSLPIVVLAADIPLGRPGVGSESHPMNAPDAPGKDRMEPLQDDPWRAPLHALNIYELLRHRFLDTARAVMNIDVYDVLPKAADTTEPSVFDAALADSQGVIALLGERCYPWALRKTRRVGFGEHICIRFDGNQRHRRWVIAPQKLPPKAIWRLVRIAHADTASEPIAFYRFMALRFYAEGEDRFKVTRIVPKSSLIESQELLDLAISFGAKPVRMPKVEPRSSSGKHQQVAVVTTMKNEGPFILEWLAYHRAIGIRDFIVYTNDCDDGTDTMLDLLQEKGIVQHRDNPFRDTGLKPQHAALAASEKEPIIQNADWAICMDVDEFINIHAGDGMVQDLFEAVPDANMISLTWRLFGNDDVEEFCDEFITERFSGCAPLMTRKPHQAWGFKTLFRNIGLFKKMGVHRPKGLRPQLVDDVNWVNGSGIKMPKDEYRNAWRSTTRTVGYDLVSLNHYAVRSAESFLVKRDRGRVNHVDRDQGLAYWFRMNNNAEQDHSIKRMLPELRAEFEALLEDPDIAAAHAYSVARHRTRIDELKAAPKYSAFYAELIGDRLQRLSRLHTHFGSAVFLSGPGCIPDDILTKELPSDFLFTVPKAKTEH